jgi:hypothetical protein
MARILVNGEWFNELSVDSLYESEFENLFIQESSKIFPGYIVVNFKTIVESEYGNGKPDLALIEKNYYHWYVVEVEKSNHPLDRHVLPQVRIFSSAEYNDLTATALKNESVDLDLERLKIMIKGQQPKVLIVVNTPMPEWIKSLSRWEAMLSVFQVFRSEKNKHIYRLNGFTPKPLDKDFSECYIEKVFKRSLVIQSPTILEEPVYSIVTINYKDSISTWKRIDMQNRVMLCPFSINPLDVTRKFKLYREGNNSYSLTD